MTPTVVWKFRLVPGVNSLRLPAGAEALTVGVQAEDLVMWVRLNPSVPEEERRDFRVLMTGEAEENLSLGRYVGTTVLQGWIVVHVFEVVP